MPADSFTPTLNLRKPEVGAAIDTWGGVAGLNGDLDIIDAIFLATGLSTVAPVSGPLAGVPGVGLRIGAGKVLNVEGSLVVKGASDATKGVYFTANNLGTGSLIELAAPVSGGTIATVEVVTAVATAVQPVGTLLQGYYGGSPPSGYVFVNGLTIGDASSGATNRAHADCERLFKHLWNFGLPVFLGGSPSSRTTAAADWSAHKALQLPDHAGRTMAARDNLSGTAAGRLTVAGSGIAGTTWGAAGGDQFSQNHTHTITDPGHSHGMLTRSDLVSTAASSAFAAGATNAGQTTQAAFTGINATNGFGFGGSQNVQPTIVVDVVIAL